MSCRRTGRWAASVVLALLAGSLAAPPAAAATVVTPGSFTGFAFDTCDTPSSADMDVWRETSPFWGVGVYLGGVATTCDNSLLTETWVTRQANRGWRILPLWVGPQAVCSTVAYAADIDPRPANEYAAAADQGRANANQAVRRARALGISAGGTLGYDIEDFGLSDDDCRRSALTFLSAWTRRLHALGYPSGVYSNVSAAIDALDFADTVSPGSYALPDQVCYAWDNGRGSVAPKPSATCGVRVDFADYRLRRRGATGAQVKAAQCLLRKKRLYDGQVHGRYDRATGRAVRAFQRSRLLQVTGTTTAPTWTALLSDGRGTLVKRGSVGDPVRRVQRGLTAALDRKVAVTGVFGASTTTAVMRYQRRLGLPRTGVMDPATWAGLTAGRR